MKEDLFILFPDTKLPPSIIKKLIANFWSEIETFESKNEHPFFLLQDGKSEAYYVDCHLSASTISDKLDYEASLDPEEQDDIKANRSLLPLHKLFLKMQDDAKKGRQFNDIIVEYMPSGSRADKPLKIYGGQHRAKSMKNPTKLVLIGIMDLEYSLVYRLHREMTLLKFLMPILTFRWIYLIGCKKP